MTYIGSMIRLPTSRTLTIPNEICAYCGIALLSSNRSRDHVLSRKFVPHGTLHNSCNIGIWTCKKCNGFKSELEDDISAITMLIGPDGKFARDDERLINTSARKQKGAISKATKRRVAESHPEMKADIPFGAGLFSFNFVAQPTIEEQRAARLAWLQIQGIWFYQTYDPAAKRGKFWQLYT